MSAQRLTTLLAEAAVPLICHHTSGQAHVDDLARLVEAFSADSVVPICSDATDCSAGHFPRVEVQADDEWWEV